MSRNLMDLIHAAHFLIDLENSFDFFFNRNFEWILLDGRLQVVLMGGFRDEFDWFLRVFMRAGPERCRFIKDEAISGLNILRINNAPDWCGGSAYP